MNRDQRETSEVHRTSPADRLRHIPAMHALLAQPRAVELADIYGRLRLKKALEAAVASRREALFDDKDDSVADPRILSETILSDAAARLAKMAEGTLRPAVNAAGIVLHTALGRSVWPDEVVDSMAADLKGYVTLAADRRSGLRSERDNRLEAILTELTGAEAAAVVNNNAGATLLVLAALAAGRETVISRGQLIEIGGAFRLPDVMAAAGTTMVEVGATNRTHGRDYVGAINERTGLLMRAHPSNFRVTGFTGEVTTAQLAEIAAAANAAKPAEADRIAVVDDLGAGALVDLEHFGLPHEPTVAESLAAGADICLFSGDKLIGAAQAGIIVGRADLIARIRRHPLHRALRADKTCLMALERTLQVFARGDIDHLKATHPLYAMLALDAPELTRRAEQLAGLIRTAAGEAVDCRVADVKDYPGGGSLPTEAMAGKAVRLSSETISPTRMAEALRLDETCVFSRVGADAVWLHVRTIFPRQFEAVAAAVARAVRPPAADRATP